MGSFDKMFLPISSKGFINCTCDLFKIKLFALMFFCHIPISIFPSFAGQARLEIIWIPNHINQQFADVSLFGPQYQRFHFSNVHQLHCATDRYFCVWHCYHSVYVALQFAPVIGPSHIFVEGTVSIYAQFNVDSIEFRKTVF